MFVNVDEGYTKLPLIMLSAIDTVFIEMRVFILLKLVYVIQVSLILL